MAAFVQDQHRVSVQVSAQACLRVIMQSTTVTAEPAGRAARSDHRRGRRSVRQDRSYPARPVEQSRRRAPGAARSRRVPRKEHEQCIGRHHPAAPAAGCVLCWGPAIYEGACHRGATSCAAGSLAIGNVSRAVRGESPDLAAEIPRDCEPPPSDPAATSRMAAAWAHSSDIMISRCWW